MITTCQICGRSIMANTGMIAHHGYRRPDRGSGWQTASCFGAKWRPYEVACDALPPAIEQVKSYLAMQTAALADWLAEPPATLTYQRYDAYKSPRGPLHTFDLPADFDVNGKDYCGRVETYVWQYRERRDNLVRSIKNAESDLAGLKRRLAEWKAPVEAVS